jgi:hypothetical protein
MTRPLLYAIPEGTEAQARDCYSGVLGMVEVEKPPDLKQGRGVDPRDFEVLGRASSPPTS